MNGLPVASAPNAAKDRGVANRLAAHALNLATDHGIAVFPCRPSKRPYTPDGFKSGTTDPEQIARWWSDHPGALVGVPTGTTSGLLVIDIDPEGAEWYVTNFDRLRAGRIHKTKRGHHLFFRMPNADVRCSTSKVAPGVDVRANGGYVVWWPASGLEAVGDLVDVSDPPKWLLDLLLPKTTTKTNVVNSTIPDGQRNATLASLAGTMRRRGVNADEITVALLATNSARCNPPLPEPEVRGIGASIGMYEPAQPVSLQDFRRGFRLVRAGDLKPRPLDWLVAGLFERDTVLQIFGDPGSAKSFMALDLACCIAAGTEYHGRTTKQGPAVYIAGEGFNGLARRLRAWSVRNGIDLDGLPLHVSTAPALMTDPVSLTGVMAAVDDIGETPALIVVDTLARNFGPGDENNTQDMTGFVRACDELRIAYHCTVALVHHSGHGDKSRSRGSSVLHGAVDTAYQLQLDGDTITAICKKMKDGPMPDPFAFEFRTVELGFENEDGSAATSAVLHPVDVPDAPARATGKNQKSALDYLDEVTAEHRANLESAGNDPDTARVTLTDWREFSLKHGMRRQGWYDAKDSLVAGGLIAIEPGSFVSRQR